MDLTDRLATERRGRLAAERLLELKSRELFEANRKLSNHALTLSGQIIEQRDKAERLKEHSEQVQAELRRAEEHVEVIERRLWDSVETITDGFAVFDAQDRLIAANTAWLSIFDYSEQIGPGTLYLELLRLSVEDGYVDLQGALPGEWIGGMLERWDGTAPMDPVEVRLNTGAWYRFVDRRARDGDMVCLAQNITAMKEREAELEEARHRAEAANRAKSAFLANMSHELRTPMNGVVAMADVLLETEMEDEPRLYVSTIKSSGEALLDIINHVLDFSKMEAERLVLRPEPFDLERLLHEVVTLLGPTARDKSLSMHIDYDLFSPTRLVGDAMRIRQILINLVGNAVKFTEAGHILIGVLCHEAGAGDWAVTVTVEDTGIGIAEEMQEHIFGSFAQVECEQNRAFEGTGLGLAITRELVELMGGEIWVESAPEEGTCFGFRITLPAAEPKKRLLPKVDTTIGRAMVVAPEGHETAILCRQLGQLGLDVVFAASGRDALALVRAQPPVQITVIDDALGDISGPDLACALDEASCASARLLICGSSQTAARHVSRVDGKSERLPEGIHAILSRPMLRSDLFDAIARMPEIVSLKNVTPKDREKAPAATRLKVTDLGGGHTAPSAPVAKAEPSPQTAEAAPPPPPAPTERHCPAEDRTSIAPPKPGFVEPEYPPNDDGDASFSPGNGPLAPDMGGAVRTVMRALSAPDGAIPDTEATAAQTSRLMRVLAAEDNKTNRFVLEKLLARLNIELHIAVDGQEAVEKSESLEPDLILMDISMPRLDGKAAARAIRAREAMQKSGRSAHVPIVAMTAHALEGDKEDILASGIDGYMAKPLKRAQLTSHILEHCPKFCAPPVEEEAAVG